jgi:hypothetical protein
MFPAVIDWLIDNPFIAVFSRQLCRKSTITLFMLYLWLNNPIINVSYFYNLVHTYISYIECVIIYNKINAENSLRMQPPVFK